MLIAPVSAVIRRLAARRNLDVRRRPIWRAPVTVLLVVLAVRGVLLEAGTQREWAGRTGYILGLVAIAVVGWLLTAVALVLERAMLARFPDAELENRRSRHVRTKIILVTRVVQSLIGALREELGRILERSSHWDRGHGDIAVEDATARR